MMKKCILIFLLLCIQKVVQCDELLLALNDLPHERVLQLCQSVDMHTANSKQSRQNQSSSTTVIPHSKLAAIKNSRKQEFKAKETERLAKSRRIRNQDDELRAENQKKRDQWLQASRQADEIKRNAKLELLGRAKKTRKIASGYAMSRQTKKSLVQKNEAQLNSNVLPLPKIVQNKLAISATKTDQNKKEIVANTVHSYLALQEDNEWIVPASLPTLRMGIPLDSKSNTRMKKKLDRRLK